MSPQEAKAETGISLTRKLLLSLVFGAAAFAGSTLLDGPLQVTLPYQLLLTTIVGGVTLLAQQLIDLEKRLFSLEEQQLININEARKLIDRGFSRISEATRIFNLLENSALPSGSLTLLVRHSEGILPESVPLIRDLAGHEIDRVSAFLKALSSGQEVFYDGEDREWLLGLAQRSQRSIVATSLATIDAGGAGFEGGLWKNDLGSRYLDLQREAIERGVRIRRIFVFDRPKFVVDPDFVTVRRLQLEAGIEVRVLENRMVPNNLKSVISDFVVFDRTITYETTPATRMDGRFKPAILETRLVLDKERVERRASRFEELWKVAQDIDDDVVLDVDAARDAARDAAEGGSGA